jgi:hypothetical protein
LLQSGAHGDGLSVTSVTFWNLLPLLVGLLGAQPGPVGQTVTRLIIQDEVILRVPVQPRPLIRKFSWDEKKGPKCIPVRAIAGASLSSPDQLDFILANHARVRAKLDDDCPGLDFYGMFYLQPEDDELCAKRDVVHTRMGGSCQIDRFKVLIPKFSH